MGGIDVNGILSRDDSKDIMERLRNPKVGEEKLLIKMIKLGRHHIVNEMINLKAETKLDPEPLQCAIDAKNYDVCKTLININDKNINKFLHQVKDNKSKFLNILKDNIPEV